MSDTHDQLTYHDDTARITRVVKVDRDMGQSAHVQKHIEQRVEMVTQLSPAQSLTRSPRAFDDRSVLGLVASRLDSDSVIRYRQHDQLTRLLLHNTLASDSSDTGVRHKT